MAEWSERSACRQHNADDWFHPSDASPQTAHAVKVCGGCPVRQECLAYSLEWAEYGVWGGLTTKERKALRREQGVTLRKVLA